MLPLVGALCLGPAPAGAEPRILVMGDSLLAMHKLMGLSVSASVESSLGVDVTDTSVAGARFLYRLPITGALGLNITKQYRRGDWDWTVLNGGGNDLWLGCGCMRCKRKLDRLISQDGRRGVIPGFVSKLRHSGAQVVYVGYMRTPGITSPVEHCTDEGAEMDRRVARLAGLDRGVHFLPLSDLVPHGDRSYHGVDLIHPSFKASRKIGQRIARLIAANESTIVSRNSLSQE
ncbi:SGNH/GDSL hydrolase family protein [uncultured Roseovarius sp.]|uniref:SGNH/GDSL hydrolase family protein n=1 Tax=uncultured Roseovarius sp. TaxID=293344 RepID=UPI00261FC64D|nr:SGNH/GDSL hydrolase family protein [uncultured Roseovarius sp.]